MNRQEFRRKKELLEALRRRLHYRKLQAATQGINTDPAILMEVEDIKQEVHNLEHEIVGVPATQNQQNVLHIHEDTIHCLLPSLTTMPHQSRSRKPKDVTEYINLIVQSVRFATKIQFSIPQDITTGAFINLVVDTLSLPRSKSVDELMISFSFEYSVVYQGTTIPLNKTLRDTGLRGGEEIQLSIKSVWRDEIKKAEIEEAARGSVMYQMSSRMMMSAGREEARRARGVLTQSKINSLADECFAFVDHISVFS